jgi:hypothetical protein
MTNYDFSMLQLENPRLYRNHSSICYSASLTTLTNYILILVKPFSFVCYVIPLSKTGALASTRDFFLRVDDEKTKQNTHPMATFSVFYQSPGPPPLGNARGIVLAHRHGHQIGQQSWFTYLLSYWLLLPWQPLGQYLASSRPMAASSGFQGRPEHDALGDAVCTALAHRRDH